MACGKIPVILGWCLCMWLKEAHAKWVVLCFINNILYPFHYAPYHLFVKNRNNIYFPKELFKNDVQSKKIHFITCIVPVRPHMLSSLHNIERLPLNLSGFFFSPKETKFQINWVFNNFRDFINIKKCKEDDHPLLMFSMHLALYYSNKNDNSEPVLHICL